MSDISQFILPGTAFDPGTLLILGDVYDRACARFCAGRSDLKCGPMAQRIIAAAMNGERDPDKLWRIAIRGV
jgi:hypothetical protein